jgi:aminopeptidase N
MPGLNLTRFEASFRSRIIGNAKYYITLDLMDDGKYFDAITTIEFDAIKGTSTFIDLVATEVYSITLNNHALDAKKNYNDYRVGLSDLEAENRVCIRSKMKYSNVGEGLHKYIDPVDKEVYLYSQFEVPDSRQVFATFEQPDIKGVFNFTIIAPSRWAIMSTAPTVKPVRSKIYDTEKEEASIWTFHNTPKLSSYVTGIVAGPYFMVKDELTNTDGRTIPLTVACRQSVKEHLDYENIIDITKKGFEFYGEIFDFPYPYAKYDQIFVPEFNAGAMENVGLITYTDSYVFTSKVPKPLVERRAVTILHELAHMWFGDLVTMKWWNDLWLNESFAEYMSTLATAETTEFDENWVTFNTNEKTRAVAQDMLPSTHPIAARINNLEDVQVNFDMITYAKGASVLKHLVAYVGRDNFFEGIHNYLKKYSYSNATLADLVVELEAASGRDLKSWCLAWLESPGTNTLTPIIDYDETGTITKFQIKQGYPEEYQIVRPHRLGIGFYNFNKSNVLIRTDYIEIDVDGYYTNVSEIVGKKSADLIVLNDNDLTFTKIELDDKSFKCVKDNLEKIKNDLTRSVVWNSLFDAMFDKKIKLKDFLDVSIRALKTETNSSIIKQQILNFSEVINLFTPDTPMKGNSNSSLRGANGDAAISGGKTSQRAELQAKISDLYLELISTAPDSDIKLQYLQALTAIGNTKSAIATAKNLLSEGPNASVIPASPSVIPAQAGIQTGSVNLGNAIVTQGLDSIEIDNDLKWNLLGLLVNNSEAGIDEIKKLLKEKDNQVARQYAAKLSAQIPTEENKEFTFSSLFDKDDKTNAITRWTSIGYSKSYDSKVFEKTAYKYFDYVKEVWNNRDFQIAEQLIEAMYPVSFVNEEFLQFGENWLEENKFEPEAMLRLVRENVWWTKHALQVQEFNK